MTTEVVLFGPPGTGKTTAGIEVCRNWFRGGVSTEDVAYLAFTRAAAREALGRIIEDGIDEEIEDCHPFFRTIHSLAYRGLREAREGVRVVGAADMKQFAKETAMEGSYAIQPWEDLAEVYRRIENHGRTWCDQAMTAYTLSRITARSPDGLDRARLAMSDLACATVGFLEEAVYREWVAKYEAWKARNGLVDFTDMLEFALRAMKPLDCRKVVIDEAQDLCPLHYAILDRLFESAEEVWWIGDDDQTIYQWSGASARFFIERSIKARHRIELRETHRFGPEIVEFSKRIIRRVRQRVEKDVIGLAGKRHSIAVAGRLDPFAGNGLILHRHVEGCQGVARVFMDAGLPFRNERGRDPLGAEVRVRAWRALDDLARGKAVSLGSAALVVEELLPSLVVSAEGEKDRLVTHGGKKRIERLAREVVRLGDLLEASILTGSGASAIRERKYAVMRHADDLTYYDRLAKNGYDTDSEGPTITTIHGAKGRQADRVVVFSEMSRRCWEDADSEHRLAYVAATRTRGDLTICAERTVDWAHVQYEYPKGGNDAELQSCGGGGSSDP